MNQDSQHLPKPAGDHVAAVATDSLSDAPVELRTPFAVRAWRLNRAWIQEAVLVVTMYMLYSWTRSAAPDRVKLAFNNADFIESVQRGLGIDIELSLNRLFLRNLWLADAASYFYQVAHMVVTFGVLIWLFVRKRPQYGQLRTSLAFLWLAGLATYWLYPLAPPRFALDGAVDTMAAHPVLFAGQESVTGLANLYAAMPSLHVGWSVWVAIAIISVLRSPWRYAAILYPCTMTFVVVGTANHYVLDAVCGAIYAILCFYIARWVYARQAARRAERALQTTPDLLEA